MPKHDQLRSLWMSLTVPTNPLLLGLTKDELLRKRVCEKLFDQTQFTQAGATRAFLQKRNLFMVYH